jgi:hypothetical protein
MKIMQIDCYIVKLDQPYKLLGVEEAPDWLRVSDLFFKSSWCHSYSRKLER